MKEYTITVLIDEESEKVSVRYRNEQTRRGWLGERSMEGEREYLAWIKDYVGLAVDEIYDIYYEGE